MRRKTRIPFSLSDNYFWLLLIISVAIHFTALSRFELSVFKPVEKPEYVEVEIVYPEPAPKPKPVKKPEPIVKPTPPPVVKTEPKPAPEKRQEPVVTRREETKEQVKKTEPVPPEVFDEIKRKLAEMSKPDPRLLKEDKPIVKSKPVKKELPEEEAVQPKAPPEIKKVEPPTKAPEIKKTVVPPKPVPKPLLDIESSLTPSTSPKAESITKTTRRQLNIPTIAAPESDEPSDIPINEKDQPFSAAESTQDRLPKLEDSSSIAASRIEGIKPDEFTPDTPRNIDSEIDHELKDNSALATYKIVDDIKPGKTTSTPSATDPSSSSFLEGEIRNRKIISKPDPPALDIDRTVTITLEFTVLPNGVVDQIFPVRKADPRLESLAIKLLREYRFEALFESEGTQQGIIHFTIKQKN